MKIAILTRYFPPGQLGGTETASYHIAKEFANKRHEVAVITTRDSSLPKKTVDNNFVVHRVRFSKNRILKYPGLILYSIKTLLILRKFKPNIIHAQAAYMGVPAIISKLIIKKPYVLWLQGSDIYLPGLFKSPTIKLVLRQANAVIALTEDMKTEARKFCNREILVIPNGVDPEEFGLLSKSKARQKLKLQVDGKIIIFVGNLRQIKGVQYLIKAMNIIKQECTKAQLLLVGDGEERESLESLVNTLKMKQCVSFIGAIPNENVSDYLCASDIFVLPSLSEGFPITFLEAMACGLPIVATRVRGLLEIISEEKNGFLVEPRNSTQIAEKVIFILHNDRIHDQISRNNKKYAYYYSWKRITGKLEEVYSQVTRVDAPDKWDSIRG